MSYFSEGKNCKNCDVIFYKGIGDSCSRQCHNLIINKNRDYTSQEYRKNQ